MKTVITPDYSTALAILDNCTHGPDAAGNKACCDCWNDYVDARDVITKAARAEARKINGPKPKARPFLPYVAK
jgi:hypothetical protein